jgi:hypothetical protein
MGSVLMDGPEEICRRARRTEIMERNKARTEFFVDIKDFSSIISRSKTGI